MTQPALGSAIGNYDGSYVSKVETGDLTPHDDFVNGLDRVFPDMNGWFGRFWRSSRKWNGQYREWFKDWVKMEQGASVIRWYEPLQVPGLVQTPDYARAVLSWGPLRGDVEADVSARMERQAILDSDSPPELWVLLAEAAVHRCMGSAQVMREQLGYLAELSQRPNVTIQVIPDDTLPSGGLLGAFAVAASDADSAVYLETGLRGLAMHDPTMISDASRLFEHLRAEALPTRPSYDLLAKAGESWNGRTPRSGASPASAVRTAEVA